jgi:hypothetical protein
MAIFLFKAAILDMHFGHADASPAARRALSSRSIAPSGTAVARVAPPAGGPRATPPKPPKNL